jgi:hypothetical protein
MAGLNLNVGGYGQALGSAKLPYAANAPSSTISQKAFGVTTGGGLSRVPAYGSVGLGLAGAVVLVWLWYSLPR